MGNSLRDTSRPVGAAEGHHFEKLLEWMAGGAQLLHDAPRLAVERHRMAALGIEHHDADRGGLHERLEVGPRAPLGAVGASVGDRGRGLGGEQRQHLLVLAGELLSFRLVAQEEVPDLDATVAQRRAQEGPGEDPGGVEPVLADVAREVGQARWRRQVPEKLEQAQTVRPGEDLPFLVGGEAGEGQIPGQVPLVDGHDDAVAGVGEPAGAVHRLEEHGIEIEACVDSQDGGDALAQRLDLPFRGIGLRHGFSSFAGRASNADRRGTRTTGSRAGCGVWWGHINES